MNELLKFITVLMIALTIHCSSPIEAQNIAEIEIQLNIKVPSELKSIWRGSAPKLSARKFVYGAYNDMYFLYPKDKLGQFNGSEKGIIEFSKNPRSKEKILVFAISVFEEDFVSIYYKFSEDSSIEGIYASNLNQGSLSPAKIGKSIKEIFPNIEKCFRANLGINTLISTYANQNIETIYPDSIPIYPKINLFQSLEKIIEDKSRLMFYKNQLLNEVSDELKSAIIDFYTQNNMEINFENPYDEGRGYDARNLYEFINAQNVKRSNDGKLYRFFNISFKFNDQYALCLLTRDQAIKINNLGLITFDWNDRAIKEDKFMYK